MKETKAAFFKKILSSKRFKEIWKVVDRFLKLNGKHLKFDTNKLNKYFDETATRLVSQKSMNKRELKSLIGLFNGKENAF